MANIAIVGCGGIGSRHLQASATNKKINKIQCIDLSKKNIEMSKGRLREVNSTKEVSFLSSVVDLDKNIDICIIATPAPPRKKIILDILQYSKVKNFILEKIVFQQEQDFEDIIEIFKSKNINCWVNCHSRAEERYQYIKSNINRDLPLDVEVLYPKNYNLGSAMIHCLDLFCYLTDNYELAVDPNMLEDKIYNSKHAGHIEVKGTITATNNVGDKIAIKLGNVKEQTYTFKDGVNQYVSCEADDYFYCNSQKIESDFLWQNKLTKLYIDDIIDNGSCCSLPTLEQSYLVHKSMFRPIKKYFNLSEVKIT
tara:strand:+ start:3765 stop:4694 length:930 start_codon:yes stop_codon:yes gene_type:complete